MKKIIFSLYGIFLIFGIGTIHAQVVATVCIENKHSEKFPCDVTLYVENKIMGAFFDEGFIVTNLPYRKEEISFYNSYKKAQYAFESDSDYIILLYFSYKDKKQYDEFRRKNILPCENIYCKLIKRSSSEVFFDEIFELEKMDVVGIYKKLDFCLSVLIKKTVDAIRRTE